MAELNEVVISGIGGMFPESNNVDELKNLLFNKMNGITVDSRRWNPNELGVAAGTGKIQNVDKFDSMFFNAHPKLAEVMDVLTKLSLERSIEAIIDAGLSPADLYGTNTAVFMGSAISETEMMVMDCSKFAGFSMLGRSRTMQANRVSYILNLTGPSLAMDGGWMCGSNGLQKAKEMIESGVISTAIVGVSNVALRPEIQFQFQGLNRLNRSTQTKSFSSDADGYNRSEACVVLFLQKASEAKRSYGTLLSVKSVQFGDHRKHFSEHVGNHLKSLLLDCYKEANVDPATIDFVEANGSGIKSEDSMELNIMEQVFCTKQRKTPLKVGSVKSNVGHCEASGMFVSIVKAIITLESGYIPPNINYTGPNEDVEALKTGKIQVITEKTPFVGNLIGVSSFGTLNAFSHVILKRNNKVKNDVKDTNDGDKIPRLIFVSGRNEKNTRQSMEKIKSYGNDEEFLALVNDVFTRNINAHFYRSFSIIPTLDESRVDDVRNINPKKRPVWFIFSGMGSQWQGMGLHLIKLPIFLDVINKCDSILKPRGVDIKNILTSQDTNVFDNILNSFVGIAAIQIGLVEVLKALEITPDGIIGHSVGELGCAYADGCFTLEEMILSAYARGCASIETDLVPGMMAAIGLGYHQIKDLLPHDIDVACHNSATSCTISGPVDSINSFVTELKSKGVFAKAVNVAGIAYHSRYIQSAGPTLLKYLKDVIKEPKMRSSKWISSSLPEAEWSSDLAKYSSSEYHTNNLLSSVLFENSLKHIPSDAITIEIAPHGLLQSILRGALPETVTNIPLTKKIYGDSVRFLLDAIGKMYTNGLNPKVQELYPKVSFPVSRGTPSINELSFWDHTQVWSIDSLNKIMNVNSGEKLSTLVLNDNIHLTEYEVHGHHLIPLSFILFNVWKNYIEMNSKIFSEEPIQFHNLKFKNNVKIHPTISPESYLMIQLGSGLFEYTLDNEVIFSGQIEFLHKNDMICLTSKKTVSLDSKSDDYYGSVSKDEIYNIFENNGFNPNNNFKNITNIDIYKNNIQGYVKWTNDWIYFMDGLLKFPLIENVYTNDIQAPFLIRQITIVPMIFNSNEEKDIFVDYNKVTKEITCAGVKISDVRICPIELPKNKSVTMKIEEKIFIKFNQLKCKTIKDFMQYSLDVIMEADRLNFSTENRKLIMCTPYHYDDPISKVCTKEIKQMIENQQIVNSITLSWDNIKNTSEFDESGSFITVTNVNYLQETSKALANKRLGYIVVCSKQKLQDLKDWKIITQENFEDNNYLVLMKKKIILDGNCIFIKPINDNYDSSIWTSLKKHKSPKALIYIILNKEPLEGVNNYVAAVLRKYESEKLRFLFIFDSNAPDFECNKSFYINQLSIGFSVNIYKNGEWGFYKKNDLHGVIEDKNLLQNPMLKYFSSNKNNKLTLKYLGLNFIDLVVESNTENKFGPLEYTGFIENNKMIMGISSFKKKSPEIIYDPYLMWPVPSTWSLEDATTVPLSYAMSYYVFNVLSFINSDKSVLVTSGLHPIGQAAISISLAEKCMVYAIVNSSHEADKLSNTFPELSRDRVLINTKNQIDIKLKIMTKGKGVDIIFNFLSGEAFKAVFNTVADHGKFFNFSKSDMKTHRNLGTRQFLQDTSFFAVGSDILLNESDENKLTIQQAIMNGLNKGIVKPFRSHVLSAPFTSDKIFATMRTAFELPTSKKVLLSLNDITSQKKLESETYQCNPDHVYIIVDHKSDWLDLAEWLVERGAQKLVIALKRCLMSTITCRKFDRLISRNVSVQIESDSHLQTKEGSLNWLQRLTSSNVLGSLFIINQIDEKKINNLRYSFEKYENKTVITPFICILSKGEHVCNELKSIGINALNISWNGLSLQPKGITKILSALNLLLQTSNTSSSSFVCSEKGCKIPQWNHQMNDVVVNFFPGSLEELHLLNDKITKEACFIEVSTKSPRLSQLKSVTPVFVIPGFKPKLLESFYKKIFYPAFEAQLPEQINSIDELSENLVNKLKGITDQSYVSLIGESWGGIVALKMAQILEAQGTLVTVALLEGDPEVLTSWAKSCFSNDIFTTKLTAEYNSFSNEFPKYALQKYDEDLHLSNTLFYQQIYKENIDKSLDIIRSRLQALLKTKPLLNKLHTKVLIFRYERPFDCYKTNLNNYCIHPPIVHIINKTDYKSMLMDKETIEVTTKNIVYSYPVGVELSLSDKYNNYYFNVQKFFKCIN